MGRTTSDKRSVRSLLAEECEARLCLNSVSFVPHDVFAVEDTGERLGRVVAADMDGDGDIDVLSTGADNKIAWYENDGAGNFEEAGGHQFERRPSAFFGADVNGDGNGDLIVGVGRQFVWYEDDGTGSFDVQHVISENYRAKSLIAADVDGDGDVDLLTTCDCDGLAWYENTDGAGSFGKRQSISVVDFQSSGGAQSVVAADLDGDGDVDALSAWKYQGLAFNAWSENTDGAGNFGKQQVISTRGTLQGLSVFAADMDGDGDMDVLSAFASASSSRRPDDTITWYEKRLNGDSNDDNVFNSTDLVEVFRAGKYEDGIDHNATFDEGDWNLDGDFDSSDLVAVFEAGHYVAAARPLEAEIAAAVELAFGDDEDLRTAFVP